MTNTCLNIAESASHDFSSTYLPIITTFIGIFAGWGLSETSNYLNGKKKIQKKIKAIDAEVDDIYDWLIRLRDTALTAHKNICTKETPNIIPNKIRITLFEQDYGLIAAQITLEKRRFLNDIYTTIESINKWIEQLENYNLESKQQFGIHLHNIYMNAGLTAWKILHIKKKGIPADDPQMAEEYKKIENEFIAEWNEIQSPTRS